MQSKPNPDRYANSNSNIDAYGYRNSHCHGYINSDGDADSHGHVNSDSDADCKTNADSQSCPVSKTSPDAYAAADRLGRLCYEAFAISPIQMPQKSDGKLVSINPST